MSVIKKPLHGKFLSSFSLQINYRPLKQVPIQEFYVPLIPQVPSYTVETNFQVLARTEESDSELLGVQAHDEGRNQRPPGAST